MHLLPIASVSIDAQDQAVDLGLAPRDIVFFSFTDSDLGAMAAAWHGGGFRALSLIDLKRLRHPMSVDLVLEQAVAPAKFVLIRCLGGYEYWRYGIDQIATTCRARGISLAVLAGDGQHDPRFAGLCTIQAPFLAALDAAFQAGGVENFTRILRAIDDHLAGRLIAGKPSLPIAKPVAAAFLGEAQGEADWPRALVIGYRSAYLAGVAAPVEAMVAALAARHIRARALYVTSLKDPAAASQVCEAIAREAPAILINTTAFSAANDDGKSPLDAADCPVLQAIIAGSSHARWQEDARGLSPADMAMNVVLPECDGRLIAWPIAFKAEAAFDPALQIALTRPDLHAAGIAALADLAAAWLRLRHTPNHEKRLAIVLPDYPARPGRAGYAVGLDTAASAVAILKSLAAEGYDCGEIPPVESLVRDLAQSRLTLPIREAKALLADLPAPLLAALRAEWGELDGHESDPRGAFVYRAFRQGKIVLALAPERAGQEDRRARYHDAFQPPSWSYAAFFRLLARTEKIDALIPLGTHGALEWLPGKAMAPGETCWPSALIGAMPVIYPFIVNDPGEASTARRRLCALTLGHLTPPLGKVGNSCAENSGFAGIEALLDEYAEAERLDPRRARRLCAAILAEASRTGLAEEAGIDAADPPGALARLHAWLCDIKDLAIRDGQHVLGQSPAMGEAEAFCAMIGGANGQDQQGIRADLAACGPNELTQLSRALSGRFVPAGPSGAPSRLRRDILLTGRNMRALDPRALPTLTAFRLAERAAETLLTQHLQEAGEPLRRALIDLWASPTFRTGGEDFALALILLGARPVWDAASGRVSGVEAVPIARLGRPRVDVTLRISGLFRDLFADKIGLFDAATRLVAGLDESEADNPLRGCQGDLARVFGNRAGLFGTGVARQALDGQWRDEADLAATYLAGVTGFGGSGEALPEADFSARIKAAQALIHSQDDRERDALDSDGVADYVGGFAAAAATFGARPALYHLDTAIPETPKARAFSSEIARIIRGRIANPRWIAGQMRHGHRGGAEFAQAVDAVFLFAASARLVSDAQFDLVHAALVADPLVRDFLLAHNPEAGRAIAERLAEAIRRELWRPRRNAIFAELAALRGQREAAE